MSNFNTSEEWDTLGIFTWATDYYDADGLATKLVPADEVIQTGLVSGEPVARVWFNRAWHNQSQYIKWLSGDPVVEKDDSGSVVQVENREPVGTIKNIDQDVRTAYTDPNGTTLSAFTDTDAALYWGGTWSWDSATTGVSTFIKTGMDTHSDLA